MRLLAVELTRFRSRRAVVVVVLVSAALAGLLAFSAAYATRPVDDTERAAVEQQMASERERAQPDYDACLADPTKFLGQGAERVDCEMILPQPDWFLTRPELDLGEELQGRGLTLLVLLAGMGILLGATFSGADWSSGSMSNQLLFVTQRWKVWLAKAVAVVVAASVAATVMVAGFWGTLGLVARSRGLDTSDDTWRQIAETSGRGLALVAAVTLGGFALTMLLRHTVATLGLLFAYAVVGEGLIAALPFDKMTRWSLPSNVVAWLEDGVEIFDDSICGATEGRCNPYYLLTLDHAAAYLGVLLALAVVASLVGFTRRDVP